MLSVRGEDDPIIIEVESKSSAYYLLSLSLLEGPSGKMKEERREAVPVGERT